MTWTTVAGAALLEQKRADGGKEREGRPGGCGRPRLERLRSRLAEQAAAEWPAPVAAVRSGGVHDQIDATVHSSRLLEHASYARRIRDVSLETNGTRGRDTVERRP